MTEPDVYRIKPLVWRNNAYHCRGDWCAKFRGGHGLIHVHARSVDWELWLGRYSVRVLWRGGRADSVEEAQQACGDAFEAYVLGFLEVPVLGGDKQHDD